MSRSPDQLAREVNLVLDRLGFGIATGVARDAVADLQAQAEAGQRLVCSWCGEDYESDGMSSDCCNCDPVPASSLPALLKDARREAQDAVDDAAAVPPPADQEETQ